MQELVSIILSREMHRPSSEKLWQMPQPAALPIIPFLPEREVPLDAHETSYFADSANIFSLLSTFSFIFNGDLPDKNNHFIAIFVVNYSEMRLLKRKHVHLYVF